MSDSITFHKKYSAENATGGYLTNNKAYFNGFIVYSDDRKRDIFVPEVLWENPLLYNKIIFATPAIVIIAKNTIVVLWNFFIKRQL